jgi:elongation factor P
MIDTGDLRKGVTIEMDGVLYSVVDWEHIKMGRGGAKVRIKMRDVRAGHIIEQTYDNGARFQRARVERQPAQFLYTDGDIFYFMNKDTFDQVAINRDRVGDAAQFLKENDEASVLTYGEEAISVELPAAVVLAVTETDPWVKGDTAQGGTKPARLETGLTVQVPLFVNQGDKVKVDTRSGQYLERAT